MKIANCAALGCAVVVLTTLSACPKPPDEYKTIAVVAQISDSQIVDEESPARAVRADGIIPYSWRPQEAYGAQTVDAMVRAINMRHAAGPPIDFAIVTGDLCDNAQSNELRWFLDTMDGGVVKPDSGLDTAKGEDDLDPNAPFEAEGLHADIPWYTVYGNHDELAVGVFGVSRPGNNPADWFAPLLSPVGFVLGFRDLDPPRDMLYPLDDQSPAILTGSGDDPVDPVTLQLQLNQLPFGETASDMDRAYISRRNFVKAHFDTETEPPGHGFDGWNWLIGSTNYSTKPKDESPLRLIVLDTVALLPPPGLPVEYGVLRRAMFETWFKLEVAKARRAGEFVLIASHHPSADFDRPYPGNTVTTGEFRAYLAAQPHIVAHICGHTHRNRVTEILGLYPYLEIETASIIDFPQEGRILNIAYNPQSKLLRIQSTIFSHLEAATPLSAESYRRAEIDYAVLSGGERNGGWASVLENLPEWLASALGGANEDARGPAGLASDRDFVRHFHRPSPATWIR